MAVLCIAAAAPVVAAAAAAVQLLYRGEGYWVVLHHFCRQAWRPFWKQVPWKAGTGRQLLSSQRLAHTPGAVKGRLNKSSCKIVLAICKMWMDICFYTAPLHDHPLMLSKSSAQCHASCALIPPPWHLSHVSTSIDIIAAIAHFYHQHPVPCTPPGPPPVYVSFGSACDMDVPFLVDSICRAAVSSDTRVLLSR